MPGKTSSDILPPIVAARNESTGSNPDELNIINLEHDIRALATQFAVSTAEVNEIVCAELVQLGQAARIRDFVPLLAIKHVKELLRSRMALE